MGKDGEVVGEVQRQVRRGVTEPRRGGLEKDLPRRTPNSESGMKSPQPLSRRLETSMSVNPFTSVVPPPNVSSVLTLTSRPEE